MCKISVIVVCLNPGDKLKETVRSICEQSFTDYEVVVKDGGSKDGSVDALREWLSGLPDHRLAERVNIHTLPDKSIYEAMNQACDLAKGEYFYFLNCGDYFYHKDALADMVQEMAKAPEGKLFYGNVYDALRQSVVQSNPKMDAFACYRHVPCHQAWIYHRNLFVERGYKPQYRVRADYEHFLWCFFEKKIQPVYVPVVLAVYEGGGFSETEANRIRSAKEHEEIVKQYMSAGEIRKYKLILALTLQPVRTAMAESKLFGGLYQALKKCLYK